MPLDEISKELIEEKRVADLSDAIIACFNSSDSQQLILTALSIATSVVLAGVTDSMQRRRLIRGINKVISR